MKKKAQTRFTPFFAKTLNPAQSLPLSLSLSLLIDLLRSLRSHISVVLPLPSLPHPPPLVGFCCQSDLAPLQYHCPGVIMVIVGRTFTPHDC